MDDSDILGDGLGGHDVVPCHHSDGDACFVALLDGIGDFLSGFISNTHYGQEGNIVFLTIVDTFRIFGLKIVVGHQFFIAEAESSEGSFGHFGDDTLKSILELSCDRFDFSGLVVVPLAAAGKNQF